MPSSKTMSGNSWRVVWTRVLGLFLGLTSIIWTSCLGDRDQITYRYLDNDLYAVPVLDRSNSTKEILDPKDEFDRRFPPPPLFPPPPPSIKGDTNALLRQAIYNNLHEKIKGDDKGKGEGGDTVGSADWPCDQFIQGEASGISKPVGPKGPTSPPGPVGPTGLPGLPGPQGDRGRRGRKGLAGPTGPQGPRGVVGPPGPAGTPGRLGAQGRAGEKGDMGDGGPRGPRGRHGPHGPRGYVGLPGARGKDGIPGLVIFPDETAMNGVELEGLLAYRQDNKQLYFRDHLTWRAIRVAQCGDGVVDKDIGEECDDGNNNNYDDCASCRRRRGPRCGNGIRETNEECDGRDFGGKACNSWKPRMTGTLYCTSSCMISYHRCRFDLR